MAQRAPRLLRLLTTSALAVSAAGLGVVTTVAPAAAAGPFTIDTGRLDVVLDSTGTITALLDEATGKNYASQDHPEALIKLVANGSEELPTALSFDAATSTYDFTFGGAGNTHALVKVTPKSGYSTFEVTGLTPGAGVDVSVLMWGPITTTITHKVGEAVGAVYNQQFAIVARPLNEKTIGGWVSEYDSLSYKDDTYQTPMPFELSSAQRTSWGSVIQHYTYDHSVPRLRGGGLSPRYGALWFPNQRHPALPGDEGKIVGSKLALFGSAPTDVLSTISGIQTGEGLVHPTIDGAWDKTSQGAQESFLVLEDLSLSNVALASQYANQAGIKYIYALNTNVGPWSSTGHYGFNGDFGGSDTGAKTLVDTAASYGVRVGVHSISNFISSSDSYTHPVPSGLTVASSTTLTQGITSTATEVFVASTTPFQNGMGTLIQLGDELASYTSVSQVSPTEWKLSGVVRGIWGTTKASRNAGQTIDRLPLNQYGGALGSVTTDAEIGTRLATVHNTVGTRAMSFDGLEGTTQSGYGDYGSSRMVNGTLRQLTGAAKSEGVIAEASNIYPNVWDGVTRLSWGEDENGVLQRANYVDYFQRSFMPGGMGWQRFTTNLPMMEAHLAKMAGFGAFAGWRVSMGTLNAMTPSARSAMFEAHKQWEAARHAGAFTAGQRNRLRDLSAYWHLSVVTPGVEWSLRKTDSSGTPIGSAESVKVGNVDPATETNFALSAKATSSSDYNNDYVASDAIDGTTGQDGIGEWASKGEVNPWLRLDWDSPQTINSVVLFDRQHPSASVNGGTLQFSDGTTVNVSGVPNDGSPLPVSFPDKTVTWVKFQVAGGTGSNNGLSEIQVFHSADPPSQNVAPASTATASSQYSASFAPHRAVDDVIGVNNTGEWASTQVNPWIKLAWSTGQTIDRVVLYDRICSCANVNAGTLSFSDGTSVAVSGIDAAGGAKNVTFPEKTVTWVTFTATGGTGTNNGLSEIQAFTSVGGKPTDYRAMWGLNSGGTDNSANHFDLTLGGNASYSSTGPKEGGASLSLDGTSGTKASSSLVTTATDNVSLSGWVNWGGATSSHQVIVSNGATNSSGYSIYLDRSQGNKVEILCGGVGVATSSVTLSVGQWTHVAAVRRNGNWELYINGTKVPITNSLMVPNAPTTAMFVGGDQTAVNGFNGLIDDVRVYGRALTTLEIGKLAG